MIFRSWLLFVLLGVAGAAAFACGGSLMDEPLESPERLPAPSAAAPAETPMTPLTSLARDDVDRTVRAGLGYFLQHGSVEPVVVADKFQGFRIVELKPKEFWAGVDLRPGDIVTSVNGMPIERDIDAYDAFQSLLRAPSLRVTFVRDGKGRELSLPIVGAPKLAVPKADGGVDPPRGH